MILTDRFVLLNYPRTGSTFVRESLREIYTVNGTGPGGTLRRWKAPVRLRELELPIDRTLTALEQGRRSQHGCVAQIPSSHAHLPLVSVTRDPLDRVVSSYAHGFWRQHPPGNESAVRARFPSFPALSFPEYLELRMEFALPDVLKGAVLRASVGPDTVHFLRFYSPDPDAALDRLTDEAIDSGEALTWLPEVRFLRQESLVDDLVDFLTEVGFSHGEITFLHSKAHVNAAESRAGRPWTDYFTPAQERDFRSRERFLFRRFPHYDR